MSGTPWQATDVLHIPAIVRQANEAAQALQEAADAIQQETRTAVSAIDTLLGERARIAAVLADFYNAPLSISAVQPILDLALELNPGMAKLKVRM